MIIYTVQVKNVLDTVLKDGIVYPCDIPMWDELEYAYTWISEKMVDKIGTKDKNSRFPFWAFTKIEDFDGSGWPKYEYLLELNIPDNEVLLSDYIKWHGIMNISNSMGIENKGFDPKVKLKTNRSHNLMFKITKNTVAQATFWAIKKEMLISYKKFQKPNWLEFVKNLLTGF